MLELLDLKLQNLDCLTELVDGVVLLSKHVFYRGGMGVDWLRLVDLLFLDWLLVVHWLQYPLLRDLILLLHGSFDVQILVVGHRLRRLVHSPVCGVDPLVLLPGEECLDLITQSQQDPFNGLWDHLNSILYVFW